MRLDETVLRYLADEAFCSEREIAEFVRLHDGTPNEAAALLTDWRANGWLESVEQDEPRLPPLLTLTDRAYEAHPWLVQTT